MCTVTWIERRDGFELLCNRDELRTRGRARPPRLLSGGGARFLAPEDGDAGGTWIAVNERAVALCLLNDYRSPASEPPGGFVSRGLLVLALAPLPTGERVLARLGDVPLERYRPFHLLVLSPGERARLFDWNGRVGGPRRGEPRQPLSSSSLDAAHAERHRRSLLRELAAGGPVDAAVLERLHRSHRPRRGPFSPCMHREDAATVSFSRVRADGARVSFEYADGPPCRTPLSAPLTLDRPAGALA